MTKNRTRVIAFRVTEEEYAVLEAEAVQYGSIAEALRVRFEKTKHVTRLEKTIENQTREIKRRDGDLSNYSNLWETAVKERDALLSASDKERTGLHKKVGELQADVAYFKGRFYSELPQALADWTADDIERFGRCLFDIAINMKLTGAIPVRKPDIAPKVAHVDGSSRLISQTAFIPSSSGYRYIPPGVREMGLSEEVVARWLSRS